MRQSPLARDQHVIGADRFPGSLQFRAHGSGLARVLIVEVGPFERPGQKRLEAFGVRYPALALGDPVPQLERHHRRQKEGKVFRTLFRREDKGTAIPE